MALTRRYSFHRRFLAVVVLLKETFQASNRFLWLPLNLHSFSLCISGRTNPSVIEAYRNLAHLFLAWFEPSLL